MKTTLSTLLRVAASTDPAMVVLGAMCRSKAKVVRTGKG